MTWTFETYMGFTGIGFRNPMLGLSQAKGPGSSSTSSDMPEGLMGLMTFYTHAYTMHIHMYVYMHICIYTYVYIYIYTCIFIH